MMTKRKIFNFTILFSIFFNSCVSTKTFLKNEQIPDDFGKGNKTILIIPSYNSRVDKAVVAAFEKYYKGGYEIGGELQKDKKITQNLGYTFNTYTDNNSGGFTAGGRQSPSADFYFGVTDMKTKKIYKMLRFGNFKKLSKLYIQALEVVRKRNE